jgi:hypothetical protein
MAHALIQRYENPLRGVLFCYDWMAMTQHAAGCAHAPGMTAFQSARRSQIFRLPSIYRAAAGCDPGRAEDLAASTGANIEHIHEDLSAPAHTLVARPGITLAASRRRLSTSALSATDSAPADVVAEYSVAGTAADLTRKHTRTHHPVRGSRHPGCSRPAERSCPGKHHSA